MKFSGAPTAIHDIQHALQEEDGGSRYQKIRYNRFVANFNLEEPVNALFFFFRFCFIILAISLIRLWRHTIFSVSCLPSRPEGRAQWQHPRPPFRQTVKV